MTAAIQRWWADDPAERYWLEVSDRGSDVGTDLNAPTTNEVGGSFWSYDLIREVIEGDIVLHYDRSQHAIAAWSRAVGSAWPDTVVWAARGTFARGANIQPHERPGIRLSLEGPFEILQPLHLERIRKRQDDLAELREGRPYFPFELGSRPTRPLQGYLFKLPAGFLSLFPELDEIGEPTASPVPHAAPSDGPRPLFTPRREDVRSRAARPWARDPSEVDRALAAHARIERLVAEAASAEGWLPQANRPDDPVFDLLLVHARQDRPAVVVEVKSTTGTNEEKQLRLALGQVLRYRQLLMSRGEEVVAMIAIEHEPSDPLWGNLCQEFGVRLVSPSTVAKHLPKVP